MIDQGFHAFNAGNGILSRCRPLARIYALKPGVMNIRERGMDRVRAFGPWVDRPGDALRKKCWGSFPEEIPARLV